MNKAAERDFSEPAHGEKHARTEYLSFRIGENEYSVDIMSVREIRG